MRCRTQSRNCIPMTPRRSWCCRWRASRRPISPGCWPRPTPPNSAGGCFRRRRPSLADLYKCALVRAGACDHALELGVFAALGAAQRFHLGEIVARLEQIALFGVPHAVIRPGAGMGGIGGQRALVPELGVFVAAELAARIADQ